ncbi:dethiobiotin synthase [Legionella jordanis]|uniref:ATP-dependent dethiobiotin synthetase BioD n=1 Tax=Legionella jordanis TaxID=456 RepID=A0A0W0VAX5_9GAMM|nr:dethiobiotin synthase [Legionella jordanis]KTD17248.1 Dethiobiotin synthetase [Legionella jordanis]RMX03362.1 dethiobiotin synthase [Legionella jordanis]RMX15840.1 dethiobiotin synthase [Legionella jordanis]VEH12554.1 Dethiobiotin synthetase [Legionella jordanis]HAT8713371.1 dethiobiotin synthase [Legionella jordanis]
MKRFFITGTDTDCGKTYVTCQILDYLNERTIKAKAIKPVASGAYESNGKLINEDVVHLQKHNGDGNLNINGWMFRPPISPHLAAKQEGVELNVKAIADFCNQAYQGLDCLLIEGAGGLMVPLNDEDSWLDFLNLSGIPAIVVVGMRVGCINHALLTAMTLKQAAIPCSGWIANCLNPGMPSLEESIETLKTKMSMPFLGRVDHKGHFKGFFPGCS